MAFKISIILSIFSLKNFPKELANVGSSEESGRGRAWFGSVKNRIRIFPKLYRIVLFIEIVLDKNSLFACFIFIR